MPEASTFRRPPAQPGYPSLVRPLPRTIEVIDPLTASILRRMSPAQRLEAANRLVVEARQMTTLALRGLHPDWTDDRLANEVKRRFSRGPA